MSTSHLFEVSPPRWVQTTERKYELHRLIAVTPDGMAVVTERGTRLFLPWTHVVAVGLSDPQPVEEPF